MLSAAYYDQESNYVGNDYGIKRYNLRSNIDIDVNKFLNVSMDLGGRIDNISQPALTYGTSLPGEPAKTFRCTRILPER